jgi:hypothetical protein
MSYGMGAAPAAAVRSDISIGRTARRDPIVAFASVMASDLLRQAPLSARRGARLAWLRNEMNKVQPGMGNKAESKVRELRRRGVPGNQALFDGVRLAFVNQIAKRMDALASSHTSGLGESSSDISAVFCGIIGVGTAGGAIAASFDNPAGSAAIGAAGSSAMQAGGCNAAALAEQARIAEANASAAASNAAAAAAAGQTAESDNTMLYVGLGVGGILLLGIGVIALKK